MRTPYDPLWKKGAGGFIRECLQKIPLNLPLKKGEVHDKTLTLPLHPGQFLK